MPCEAATCHRTECAATSWDAAKTTPVQRLRGCDCLKRRKAEATDNGPRAYSLVVPVVERGYLATVQQGRVPIASIGVAADEGEAEIVWPALVRLQRAVAEPVATRPTTTPWCAVALLVASPATSDWLGDLERCLAWAYLEGGA